MATVTEAIQFSGGGVFLDATVTPDRVFTREDLSGAQQMFGRIAAALSARFCLSSRTLGRESADKAAHSKDRTRSILLAEKSN